MAALLKSRVDATMRSLIVACSVSLLSLSVSHSHRISLYLLPNSNRKRRTRQQYIPTDKTTTCSRQRIKCKNKMTIKNYYFINVDIWHAAKHVIGILSIFTFYFTLLNANTHKLIQPTTKVQNVRTYTIPTT